MPREIGISLLRRHSLRLFLGTLILMTALSVALILSAIRIQEQFRRTFAEFSSSSGLALDLRLQVLEVTTRYELLARESVQNPLSTLDELKGYDKRIAEIGEALKGAADRLTVLGMGEDGEFIAERTERISGIYKELKSFGGKMVVALLDQDRRVGHEMANRTAERTKAISAEIAGFTSRMQELLTREQASLDRFFTRICAMALATVLLCLMLGGVFVLVRSMNDRMRAIVERLSEPAAVAWRSSQELSGSSNRLSKGVSKQAAAVQESVASMAEMKSMISQTAASCFHCNDLAVKVADKSQAGMEIMKQVVTAMGSIEAGSSQLQNMVGIIREISNRTDIINEIVFKTQLLSVNASIEAARAGQHGRGFSVVAEEVGELAAKSGSAAQEISQLLVKSMHDVETMLKSTASRVTEGRVVSNQALKAFGDVAADISAISRQLQDINNATREQASGVSQISNAMVQLDETAHSNSGISQSVQGASMLLGEQSRAIHEITTSIRQMLLGRARNETQKS